jgi:GNAT superfamily N-acetyltransferase
MDPASIRTDLRYDDLQPIIDLHGRVFAAECGWNATFKVYVAGPLMEFHRKAPSGSRIWIAEEDGKLAGCVAVVGQSSEEAQLRWFLVDPDHRRQGLGTRLLTEAVEFAREQGVRLVLWTERSLTAAARLYERAGFVKTEEKPGWKWGAKVVEEKYEWPLRGS